MRREGGAIEEPRRRALPLYGLIGIALFLLVALWVASGVGAARDREAFMAIAHGARSSPLTMRWLTAASALADAHLRMPLAVALTIGLLLARKWRAALFTAVAILGGAALSSLIKLLTARARPDLLPQLDGVTSLSFPSGHAWNATLFYGVIAVLAARIAPAWRWPLYLVAGALVLTTGIARIALGVHWPSDVLAGWIGGFSWLLLCRALILADGTYEKRR